MRKYFRLVAIATIMLGLAFVIQPTQANSPSTVLASILDKMANAGNGLKTLKANLQQQKINTQIGVKGPIENGTIYYRPLGNGKYQLRIDYTSPEQKTVVVDGEKFTLYQPNLKQMLESTIQKHAKSGGSGLTLRFDASLKEKYNISYIRDEEIDGIKTSVLAFIPKPGVQAPFKRLEQSVDHRTWLPIKIQITEKNNDVTWMRLGNLQPNVKLAGGFFSVKPQPGTKVIKG